MTWVVDEADRRLTPNRYHADSQPWHVKPIEFMVYHFTAGELEPSIRWLCSLDAKASAHFVIAKTGRIVQLCSLDERTWHAGGRTSMWRGGRYVNDRSIGIELENWGKLKKAGDGFATWTAKHFEGEVFIGPDGAPWDAYPEKQLRAVVALTKQLVERFPILADGKDRLVGHQDVDPTRKTDPGPAFAWQRVRNAAKRATS